MRIIHVGDIHIRNLKFHSDYRRVFNNFYRKLDDLKPDIVVNCGDLAHTKTSISPEFVEMCSGFHREIAKRAMLIEILGNHDMNLMNKDRQDAITPIVESINSPRITLCKKSGRYSFPEFPGFNFWAFSLADQENYPLPNEWKNYSDDINVGLFHGSISHCVTDSNWHMTHVEHDISMFDELDYTLMADIHKQQFFGRKNIAYAGSLIQQNFGEEIDKGFLLWDIKNKTEFDVTPVILTGSRKFHTIKLPEDLTVPNVLIDEGSRIRISPPRQISLVEQKEIEKSVKKLFKPHDVITLSAVNIGEQKTRVGAKSVDFNNLRDLPVQERLIRDYLKEKKLDAKLVERILELNKKYQIHIEQKDDSIRNVTWRINKLVWSNMFNYGENNVIDFGVLGGLTGIFGPNASGKSNTIDILTETCFDNQTKGVNKNISLINDNKDLASMIADITANEQNYLIERTIERIKYGQRKLDETKEWGKTSVNFSLVDDAGGVETLTGMSRPETERSIRQRVGTFEDFMLTSLSAQWNMLDIIACKETKRKEILYKFLDFDIFEQKAVLAKEDSKEIYKLLDNLESDGLDEVSKNLLKNITMLKSKIELLIEKAESAKFRVREIDELIITLTSQKTSIPIDVDEQTAERDLEESSSEMLKLEMKISEQNIKLQSLSAELAKVLKFEMKFDVEMHKNNVSMIDNLDSELDDLRSSEKEVESSIKRHTENVAILGEVPCGDSFVECKFLMNVFKSKNNIIALNKELVDLKMNEERILVECAKLIPYKTKLDAYNKFVGEKSSIESKIGNVGLQIENNVLKLKNASDKRARSIVALEKLKNAEDSLKKNRQIDGQIADLKNEKLTYTSLLDDIDEQSACANRDIGSDQGTLDKLCMQLERLGQTRLAAAAYENYIDTMGKDGIAYRILTQKLPLINEEINKILSNAADFGVFIEHNADEQSIRIYIQYGEYKSRLIELGSGAEKMLASVALRMALLNISNLPKTNMFIIDEGFGKLDPKNIESIQRMFDYLKSTFDHVIVISHLETMKDMVDNIIEITTDEEGYAHVGVGG